MISNDFRNTVTNKDGTQVRPGQPRKGQPRNWNNKQPYTTEEKFARIIKGLKRSESQIVSLTQKFKKLESQMKKLTSKKEGSNVRHDSEPQTESTS